MYLSSLGTVGTVLGGYDDPLADDFADDLDYLDADDPSVRDAYVAWAAAVKRAGGTIAAAPATTKQIDKGMTAARYPVAVIAPAPTYTLNPLFHAWPDLWTNGGTFGWYRAPAIVRRYLDTQPRSFWDMNHVPFDAVVDASRAAAPGLQPQAAPGEPTPPNPKWYDNILSAVSAGKWIIGGLVVLTAVSYLPRRRS